MKSFKLQYAALTALLALFSLTISANNNYPLLPEETYINDLPFETEIVAENYSMNEITKGFDFSEENGIFDIPFNTACATANCRYETALAEEFELEEEAYINDIPFNTEKVVTMKNTLDFEDEAFINDIFFNTFSVVKQLECPQYAMKK